MIINVLSASTFTSLASSTGRLSSIMEPLGCSWCAGRSFIFLITMKLCKQVEVMFNSCHLFHFLVHVCVVTRSLYFQVNPIKWQSIRWKQTNILILIFFNKVLVNMIAPSAATIPTWLQNICIIYGIVKSKGWTFGQNIFPQSHWVLGLTVSLWFLVCGFFSVFFFIISRCTGFPPHSNNFHLDSLKTLNFSTRCGIDNWRLRWPV